MAGSSYKVSEISLSIANGTERDVVAMWKSSNSLVKNHLASYTVQWQYKTGDKTPDGKTYWYNKDSGTTVDHDKSKNWQSATWSGVPDNVTYVRVKITPVSTTDKNIGKNKTGPWWTGTSVTYPGSGDAAFKLTGAKTEQIDGIGKDKLDLSIKGGEDRTIYATWTWSKSHTDSYTVKWEYMVNSGVWYTSDGGTGTSSVTVKHAEYNPPESAKRVRITVTPVATTRPVNGKQVAYWTATKTVKTYIYKADPIPNKGSVRNLAIRIQGGTERDMFASWDWDEQHTVSYTVKWEYMQEDGFWYEETPTSVTSKNHLYSAKATSKRVRVTVLPVSDTHIDNGKEVAWWNASWSKAVEFPLIADDIEDAGGVTGLSIIIQSGTNRTMSATWSWNKEHTASYTVDWDYMTEDGAWYPGSDTSVTEIGSLYTAPDNATRVRVRVMPVAETHQDKGNEVAWWSSSWSETVEYAFQADTVADAGTVSGLRLALQAGTDRTLYATWSWSQDNTDSFSVKWSYDTGDGFWFENGEETTSLTQATYTAPANAERAKVQVKANSQTHMSNGVSSVYWTSDWSEELIFTFVDTPSVPSAPSVTIDKFNLIAEVDCSDPNTTEIEFQIVLNDSTIFSSGIASVTLNHAAYSCTVSAGGKYKARCRGIKDGEVSEWSGYSSTVGTIPSTPSSIISCKALSESSVELTWTPAQNADTYDVEYTTNKAYFDSSSEPQSMSVNATIQHAVITGLESGQEWFFRVRATNSNGSSGYTSPVSVILGKKPAAPTTWSLATTAVVGEDLILYWVHNSQDGSSQKAAEIEITVNGSTTKKTIDTSLVEQEADAVNSYVISTSAYTEGAKVLWRVRTRGVIAEYGDWSVQRTINVYAPPTLILALSGKNDWLWDTFNFEIDTIYTAYGTANGILDVLTSFPLYIYATAGPNTQTAVGYYVTISSMETYETLNNAGETIWVQEGEEIYSTYQDGGGNQLFMSLGASELSLENGISYKVHCSVYMDSGLSAQAEAIFRVKWSEDLWDPNASIYVDQETLAAYIYPFCTDDEGELADDVVLSVYRRDFDGTFTELARNLNNQTSIVEPLEDSYGDCLFDSSGKPIEGRYIDMRELYITDPHPALDYARYRIVAMSKKTGMTSYDDLPGYPVGEGAAVLQWDETWNTFYASEDDAIEHPAWSGTMLKLPYNLDVADTGSTDVSLINYIGREHPVSYYGTQRNFTSTWNVDIDRKDMDTLYLLRRLQRYAGDVYVREPSGSGYWANVAVSFSQTHCELIIPVTLEITRVEGGV